MTRKRRRLYVLVLCLTGLGTATALVLIALEDNLQHFYSPSQIQAHEVAPLQRFRLGGLVAEDSVAPLSDGVGVTFVVTDLAHEVSVVYSGVLPDLFREGQSVVAHGSLRADGVFEASDVLAKHDENYMPAEVVEALKEAGQWRGPEAGQ
ncbi:MAG: cytochrome c maturation protein CcmE [Alphaproteobacteria bacterium]